jgi:hypothetical protein
LCCFEAFVLSDRDLSRVFSRVIRNGQVSRIEDDFGLFLGCFWAALGCFGLFGGVRTLEVVFKAPKPLTSGAKIAQNSLKQPLKTT